MISPGILQQRIEVQPVHSLGNQAAEWVGGENHEQQEADGNPAQHRQRAGAEIIRQSFAEQRHGEGPQAQDKLPQQQGAFMRAPDC